MSPSNTIASQHSTIDNQHEEKCNLVLLALGGNLKGQMDSPIAQIDAAIAEISAADLGLASISRYWRTPAFPPGSGPDFVNAAVACRSALPPSEILARLHQIEEQAGRARGARWAPRVIDIDLLAVGDLVLPDPERYNHWRTLPAEAQRIHTPETLILPHPRLQDRAFVLVPLADIAPDWRHPVLGKSVTQMLAGLPAADLDQITPVSHEIHGVLPRDGLSCAPHRSKDGA
ncbi:2-amino-4-hydroxy-6-hydroxymethyldihydropteridine diphosphokinase [Natronohydrobacter thiooxidans]|uniref:2-amino-4-hydroxy-6- hydroxymethyldihydropteridine diphosphokinase n=1 Tax=Natronohydrobacter thiooxidans TaxID=87172 RepID=UPI000A03D455